MPRKPDGATPTIWHFATCDLCGTNLPLVDTETKRDSWMKIHNALHGGTATFVKRREAHHAAQA